MWSGLGAERGIRYDLYSTSSVRQLHDAILEEQEEIDQLCSTLSSRNNVEANSITDNGIEDE